MLLLLFIILVLIVSIPAVQTSIGNYVTNLLNKDFGTNINIDKVGLQFNGDVELKNIYIEDYKKDTLISITELNTSILSVRNALKGKLVFGDIDIYGLLFNIKKYKDAKDTNLDIFVAKFEDDNPRKEKSSFLLSSSDVSIYDGVFKLSDENKETVNMLDFEDLNINATNFLINGSDVSARINTLALKDSRGVVIKNMMTNFSYTLTDMTFDDLQIKTVNSILKGDLKFTYNREDFKFFEDKVHLTAHFKESRILLNELNTFYNEFGQNQYASFNVNLSGTLNDLNANNLYLNTSRNSRIVGNFNFKNLFSKEDNNFYMLAKFSNLSSTSKDLKSLLPNVLGASIPSSFDRLGKFTLVGQSEVTPSTIKADLNIETELGFVDSNLNMSRVNNIDNASYTGKIIFKDFDLGTLIDEPKVGNVSLNLDVNGNGFVAETLNTQIKGDVFQLVYNNYDYKNIKVAGNVRNKIFDGNLIVNDNNLKLNFTGLVDFSEKIKKYDFEANVYYANLKDLNFVTKDSISIFQSTIKMNMNASNFDDAHGQVAFKNTSYKNQIDTYYFKEFEISSRFNEGTRFIEINSPDIMEGSLSGKFVFNDLSKLFQNSIGSIYTNYIPYKVKKDQSIDFNFKIYNKIIEVFYPEIKLGKNTFIKGQVESNEKGFRLTFKSPEIKYLDNFAHNIELQVDNNNPLFNTYVEVDSIKTKYYNVSKFNLINVTVNDTLFMRSEFKGGKKNKDIYNLSFYHTINDENQSVIGFKKSDVTIKDNVWFINENKDNFNKISFSKDLSSFNIDKLRINHNNEEIKLSGFIKDSTQKDIRLNFKDVDLAKITPDIDSLKLAGNVNGKLDILQKNGSYLPNSTVTIDDFKVNDFELGSFDASIKGNENLTNYFVDVSIKDDVLKSFSAVGNINVANSYTGIDVDLNFKDFNLQPLNPLLHDVLNNIRGTVSGKTKVIGNLKKPAINGDLLLNHGGFRIPYLNVDYDIADNTVVQLKNQSFIFDKLQLTDTKFKSKAELSGSLSHVNLSDWSLDFDLNTPRFLVLNTTETEDALYYGTGFVGGRATIKGPADQLNINVQGETKAGTVFKIPLNDTESFGDNSYIHFLSPDEKQARINGVDFNFNDIKGLELDFDLDITEDAEIEIIINKSTGHALKGRGRGGMLVEINTNGKFNIYGDFSVFEGVYNFAYGGLIGKKFIVQPGGTLAWDGDPLKARINMQAVYKTQANPSPLLDNPINRSIPVDLNINLTGELEQPEPTFEFEFPNVNSTIKSELNYRLESKDDRQNQALYLLSTGSFSRGLSELNFSGTIAERLNGIINGIFTSGDSKLNVGLNYEVGENRPDYKTDDRFDLTLQTQLGNNVFLNGKVGVPVGGETQTVIAGDVQIEFLLNEEGTLRAKVFNRENSIRNFGEEIGYTQGVGIAYNVDFDTFKELLQKLFKNTKKAVKNPSQESDKKTDETLPDFVSVKKPSKKDN
ncbi:translocation/assembly module TamB domain-containing protein [Yeosuana marina]|uniref:translocation/assembly module TamB domain-containing protein n=1 Tax=Yeosuana marina TaxID=1565536 RepID=UPI001F0E30E3|nr:translocation/assembly module TamB domain-containing protein [Yeosuana marina]